MATVGIGGVVSRQKFGRNKGFVVTDGKNELEFRTAEFLNVGDAVQAELEPAGSACAAVKIIALHGAEKERLILKVEKEAEKNAKLVEAEPLVRDATMRKLMPTVRKAARKLLAAKKTGRFVLLKFHNDADGISGAFAITSFLDCTAVQSNGAVYAGKEAVRDLGLMHHQNRPILLMVDCGANQASREGLDIIRNSGVEIVMIDHHPPAEEIEGYCTLFLSPWSVRKDEDASQYPAGYLCVEVARIAGSEEVEGLAAIACAGDKSDVLPVDAEAKKKALVLDYLSTYSRYGNKLSFYSDVLGDGELFHSTYGEAREKIDEMVVALKGDIKKNEKDGIVIYTINLDKGMAKFDFKSRGKVATHIFEALNEDTAVPAVVIGYGKRTVVFRINDAAVARGINGGELVEKMKRMMPGFVENGGGHAKAAALLVRKDFEESAIREIVGLI
ncbi:MAG: DHH family phosphoesterase [Candidatus Bilamarchaeaceae archaeon]